jgi:hypothetical protein
MDEVQQFVIDSERPSGLAPETKMAPGRAPTTPKNKAGKPPAPS